MKERVGYEKLIIISVAVRGINDYIRFYSQKRPFVRDYPGKPVPERQNQSGFYKWQWVAVASAGLYASLYLAPDR